MGGQVGHPRCVQVTVVQGILRHMVCGGQVGHPGIVPVCPGSSDTRDTQTRGLWRTSWTSRDSPGVSR